MVPIGFQKIDGRFIVIKISPCNPFNFGFLG
jgi:hypothetical protein